MLPSRHDRTDRYGLCMRHTVLVVIASLALLATTGFTQCNEFHAVTVPYSDTTAPWIYNVGYTTTDGNYQFFTEWRLSSPDDSILAIGSAIDDGGLRRLSMRWTAAVQCCQNNVCEIHSAPFGGVLEDSQAGGVGSVVSNGIWVTKSVKPRDFCVNGWNPTWMDFTWTTHAEDFAGNVTDRAAGHIVYP
jgi:hypothetical protein